MKRRRLLLRSLQALLACLALLFLAVAIEAGAGWKCELLGQIPPPLPRPPERARATAGIEAYSRPEPDTYLGYPEWYIVWSYQEKADWQEKHLPSGFPHFAEVRQFWGGSCCIARLTQGSYAFSVAVIGTSFSVEYILKGAYEETIGMLTEWLSGNDPTEEDRFAYEVARKYADFVHVRPFYEFPFLQQVKGLWSQTHLWGPHPIRKWERKAFLTLDYGIEGSYSWVIEKASHATYGHEPATTYAWIENADETLFQELPQVRKIKQVAAGAYIVEMPRYQEFTAVASALAGRDVHFVEVAGNTQILLSALAPSSWRFDLSSGRLLFSEPILTRPEQRRVLIYCEVGSLHTVLNELGARGLILEHVYDY